MKKTRDLLIRHFNVEDLRDLCFHLGIPADNFPSTRSGMARELILWVERNDRWAALAEAAREMRPAVDWSHVFGLAGNIPGNRPEPPSGLGGATLASPAALASKSFGLYAAALIDLLTVIPPWETEEERRSFLVINGLQAVEAGANLGGSPKEAAAAFVASVLRFQEADPDFASETLAALYDAIASTGLFSAAKRREFARQAASLRNMNQGGE